MEQSKLSAKIMGNKLLTQIPKLVIGNPEKAGLAVDRISEYYPYRAPGVEYRSDDNAIYYQEKKIAFRPGDLFLLAQCDGKTPLFQIIRRYVERFDLNFHAASVGVFIRLKFFRTLNLVKRDYRPWYETGVYLRIRRMLTDGTEEKRWLYLQPLAKRVFELCSGAYSCREIIEILTNEQARQTLTTKLEEDVLTTCNTLIAHGIAEWIDDDEARRQRLQVFLEEGEEAVQIPRHLKLDPIPEGGEVK